MNDGFHSTAFLAGTGEMATAIREFDWAATPVGPMAAWSRSLRNIVNLVVNARHPMFLWWGPDLVQFYNDAYRPSFGLDRHRGALGARGREFWSEIWPVIGPQVEGVMARGESTWNQDHLVPIVRNGRTEEVYWTYGYSPVWDDDGRIGGTLVVVQEQTARVLAERRLRTLRDLASAAGKRRTRTDAWLAGLDVLASNPSDLPWVVGFAIDDDGATARIVGQRPPDLVGERKLSGVFHLEEGGPVRRIVDTGEPGVLEDLRALVGEVAAPLWPDAIVSMRLTPIPRAHASLPHGILAVGLSPRLPFDRAYAEFLTMAADQLANAIANAQAHEDEQHHVEALAQMSMRFRELLEQAPAGVAVFGGSDLRYDLANPVYRAITRRSDLVGRRFLDVFPELRGTSLPAVLDRVYATGEPFVADECPVRLAGAPDGRLEEFFHSFNVAPVRSNGTITGLILVAIDVTAQVRARREVQRAQERLNFTLDAAGVGHWDVNLATRAATCSARYYQIFGYPEAPGDWTFERFLGHILPADRDRIVSAIRHSTTTGQDFEVECRIRTAGGEERWVHAHGRTDRVDGVPVRLLGIVHDVSERRDLLAREQDARKAVEHASHAKDQFLATLSHELRTPMNTIIGWTDLLVEGGLEEEDVQEGLTTIRRHARAQARMIDELLDMGRIVSGKVHVDARPVRLREVVGRAIEAIAHAARAKGIEVVIARTVDTGFVAGDAALLQQVFWNLLGNAVKFTPGGGTVTVTLDRAGTNLEVAIRDTGEGIAPDFLPHAFDRFRQADGSSTRAHGGLGIGLSIVKQLVEAHGGAVRGESAGRGTGAAFIVSLPEAVRRGGAMVQGDLENEVPERAGPELPLHGARILVVDDDEDTRQLIERILAGCDAQVVTAESASDALLALDHRAFDLLVSDIGMPQEDGYDLIRQVRSRKPSRGGTLPALAVTAYGRPEDRQRALAAGFQEHLAKPIQLGRLIQACARLVSAPGAE